MRVDLPTDPTVFKLAEKLGADELTVVGALFVFWSWADTHTVDGRVDGGTSRLVDKVVHLQGFSSAMIDVGWLLVDDAGLKVPNFSRHNGESARERSLKNQRQARWRESKKVGGKTSTRPSTSASTREEKRREEIKDNSPVPVEAIRKAYNDALPMLPHCKKVSGEREKHLRARWNDPDRQTLDYWVEFFEYVAASDFLTGRSKSWGTWAGPDFDWLVNETNHVKVTEGKYENKVAV